MAKRRKNGKRKIVIELELEGGDVDGAVEAIDYMLDNGAIQREIEDEWGQFFENEDDIPEIVDSEVRRA